ncbi:hypothetical protein SAMN03159343_2539 [Klenkia marina]|uniref:EVE domain-containing protein n=1 Tax=Klenkia marina TaxID=1960309 RepID=A0A1G4YE82_9ACTN|nr:hypothetical protein [Klenkia marina]SCX51048.1 hypothetical protein SAMN03159343_2539 [Klenkia marina]
MLTRDDVACWVLKSAVLPGEVDPDWQPRTEVETTRCVRRTYRVDLVTPGDPVLLWCSGRVAPGVHAVGTVVDTDPGGADVVVRWTRLADPVPRGALLSDPVARDAEVLRMPAGSNPSWLSPAQWAAVQALIPSAGRT